MDTEKYTWSHYSRTDRHSGYVKAMQEAGLKPNPREKYAGVAINHRLKATIGIMKAEDCPTAMLAYDSPTRLLYAAAIAGLSAPRDISLMAFGDRPSGENFMEAENYLGCSVTEMYIPSEKAGRIAVQMLLEKIECPEQECLTVEIPLELHEGQTIGPVREN